MVDLALPLRRAVAWAGHAPALWLLYREPLPKSLRRPNLVAAVATVASMIAAGITTGEPVWVAAAWLLGHVAWGTYLAWRLPDPPAGP